MDMLFPSLNLILILTLILIVLLGLLIISQHPKSVERIPTRSKRRATLY